MIRFSHLSSDGKTTLAAYKTETVAPRALLQISHGMCEYILRYEGFADFLSKNGIVVFGHDHLGHGNSAASPEDLGFTVAGGGADALVEDVHALSLCMKEEYPSLPLVLFGHSMGSFVARDVIEKYGKDYTAAIICGTGGPNTPAGAGKVMAKLLMLLFGERRRSKLLRSISFMGYNKKFGKDCDKNAWLTRDDAVVEKYNADPFCTYIFTLRAYHDLFTLIARVNRRDWASTIPKDLPLLLISGEEDPVGAWGKGVRLVERCLQKAEVSDLTTRLYPDMRHEILNEIDKETVWKEILEWISLKLKLQI